jgi:glycosyltransferase involved in cell wall biosynthesis
VRLVTMPPTSAFERLGWQLPLLQRRERLDLLHLQSGLPLHWPGLPRVPVACTFHDLLLDSHPELFPSLGAALRRRSVHRAVAGAALRFAVSEFTREQLCLHHGVDPATVVLTPNGVDLERFRPGPEGTAFVLARRLQPGRYVCTIGQLEPRKNHLGLLKALALMPRPRLPLVVIGATPARQRDLQALAQDLGVADDVFQLDDVDDRELPALLRHAAVFVYPSLAEGFGLPVIEAMASGVAVVASNATALPEVCGDAALTVSPDDPTELAAALLTLLADPVRRQALARRARERVARYQWDVPAERLVRSFRRQLQVADARGPNAAIPATPPPLGR